MRVGNDNAGKALDPVEVENTQDLVPSVREEQRLYMAAVHHLGRATMRAELSRVDEDITTSLQVPPPPSLLHTSPLLSE